MIQIDSADIQSTMKVASLKSENDYFSFFRCDLIERLKREVSHMRRLSALNSCLMSLLSDELIEEPPTGCSNNGSL